MKYLFLFLLMSFLLISCNGDDDDVSVTPEETEVSLLGTWNLIAIRFNSDAPPLPDDEVPLVEVESENTVTFRSDSIITSNSRSLCSNTHFMGEPTEGVYTLVDSTYTTTIANCHPGHKFPFRQTDSILVIKYPNANGLRESKFKKIADLPK